MSQWPEFAEESLRVFDATQLRRLPMPTRHQLTQQLTSRVRQLGHGVARVGSPSSCCSSV